MKLAKSLLLGSAAALATVAGAHAADLPVTKAAPVAVEYVRVCSTYGAGFFVIPGTESCVKLGGRVRAEALVQERFFRTQDQFGFRARGRISLDVRTPTPYGLLRTFVRLSADSNSGTPYVGGSRGAAFGGNAFAVPGTTSFALNRNFTRNQNATILDQAFVQFGGLTAGRAPSMFSNTDLPTGHFGTLRFDDAPDITLFAYTYSFGNGLSATLAAEDPFARRSIGFAFNTGGFRAGTGPSPISSTTGVGGTDMPDFVGNVKYAGTWGSAQLSGAVHQVTDIGESTGEGTTQVVTRRIAEDEFGFAVSGSASVNLPMIAAGDAAWVWAGYTQGATNYLSGGNVGNLAFGSGNFPGLAGQTAFGSLSLPVPDGVVNRANNRMELTEAFSVAGGFRHFWIPSLLRSNVFGSYINFDAPSFAERSRPAGSLINRTNVSGTRFGVVDFSEYRIGGNLIWSPVAGLDIGVEVLYTNVQIENGRVAVLRGGVGGERLQVRATNSEDSLEGRVRIQRDF